MSTRFGENFRDQQRASRYPFTDSSSLVTDTAQHLDPAVFLDALLYPGGAGPRLALVQVVVTAGQLTLVFGDGVNDDLATAVINPLVVTQFYLVTDTVGRPAGNLVCDPVRLSALAAWPEGTHTFAQGAADLVASCTVPTPEINAGLLGLTAGGTVLAGDVWLVGENGVILSLDGSGNIQINVVGDPLFTRRDCAGTGATAFVTPSYLMTINNRGPDPFGNYSLAVATNVDQLGTILRIDPVGPHELRISLAGPLAGTGNSGATVALR